MKNKSVKSMRSKLNLWIGTLTAVSMALAASSAVAQDFRGLKGDNARTGKNATPNLSNPSRGRLTWFRPNATDSRSGTIIRNNTALAPNVASTAGWLASPNDATSAAFWYDQPSYADQTSDENVGAFAIYPGVPGFDGRFPAYRYTTTVSATPLPNNPAIGATQSFTWVMDPTVAPLNEPAGTPKNYALYVWLPSGGTGTGLARLYPQRYFVYQITYDGVKTYTDVVDTYAAGPGWVRLGNGGLTTNRQFAYNGTNPIQITLFNTVPFSANTGALTDNPGTSLVYADAAMAVPQIGEMQATPTISNITGGTRAVAAVNQKSIGERNNETVGISQGVVTSYDYDTGTRRWTFRPAEQAFTFTKDDLSSGVTSSAGFVQIPIGLGTAAGRGTTYYRAPLAVGGTDGVIYDTDLGGGNSALEDGLYEVQLYLAPSVIGEDHGNSVKVIVHENGVDQLFYIDMNRGPGWYSVGARRFENTQAMPLRVEISNDTNSAADIGKFSYADSVRFIGAFDSEVISTPTTATVNIRQPGGAVVSQDVVIVACEDGHIYCLDAVGNADGTTNVIWAYPSIEDETNPSWVDPNITAGIDGEVGTGGPATIAEMPTGFGRSSPIVQRVGGNDYVFIAASNGRVYCIDATGRGDYDLAGGKPGTTSRVWSYPSDYPSSRRSGTLGSFTNASLAYAEVGGTPRLYVPTESGHMYALDPAGNAASHTTTVLWDYPGRSNQLPAITTTPAIDFGRIYFGTAEDDNGVGSFYSLDATNGGGAQVFTATAGLPTPLSFVGGPATASAALIGGAAPVDTVFVANQNLNVYALDAANINNVLWRTNELNTTVTGPLTFTPMIVYDRTSVQNLLPVVVVPGDNGQFTALFARSGLTNDSSNIYDGKRAWFYQAADGTVGGTSVGSPVGFPGFMYGGDLSGNLYAWSNTGLLPGQGDPPGAEGIPENDPRGALFRDAQIKSVTAAEYAALRDDPTAVTYNDILGWAGTDVDFEWGETAYFVVYGFPYKEDVDGNATDTPSLVNFQISTDGATTRQFAVVSRQLHSPLVAEKDGYAILAFAIQGSGPNSLPPGNGKVTYTVSPGRTTSSGAQVVIATNPANGLDFRVANPLGIKMSASGVNDGIGVTTVTSDPDALVNGSPDVAATAGNNESLLTSHFGLIGHAQVGSSVVYVYDRSAMTLLRGPDRGLDQVRVYRPELSWLGGAAAVVKPIPTAIFGTLFEDLPDQRPNISLDYPNIRAENVNVTKDPNGKTENPGFSGVSLNAPTLAGGGLIDQDNFQNRVLRPTPFAIDVDIPLHQPANFNVDWTNSAGSLLKVGYSGRMRVFVDSNTDGTLDTIGGRTEAHRDFWLNGAVAVDEAVAIRTPSLDLGSFPAGAGYSPLTPWSGGPFTPWGTATDYPQMFKEFQVSNPGNVNLLNLRIATRVNRGGTLSSWGMYSSSVDEFGWIDTGLELWSDINQPFALTPQVILQKARVGERGDTYLQTNPRYAANPNLDTNGGRFLPSPLSDNPKVAVSVPIGVPVGTYTQIIRVIEDTAAANQALDMSLVNPNITAETFSEPGMQLSLKVRETRLTNNFTKFSAPMTDDPTVLGSDTAAFLHKNLQPAGTRTVNGGLVAAWTSSRAANTATQPTQASGNDQYRIYLAGVNGSGAAPGGLDPKNGLRDLFGFFSPGIQWFQASPSTTNGYPAGGYLYPTTAGETIVPGTEKYGAPSLPVRGFVNPFAAGPLNAGDPTVFNSLDMAFVGEAMKQTSGGRTSESRLFMTRMVVDNTGVPTLDATPYPMPYDPNTQKGKASVVKMDANRSLAMYSALGTGNTNIFWTIFDYNQRNDATTGGFTAPQTLNFGDGFESVGSPALSGRRYTGGEANLAGRPVYDLSFTGKLRGQSKTEVFLTRILADGAGVPQSVVNFPEVAEERLTGNSQRSIFTATGVDWDITQPIVLSIRNIGSTATQTLVSGTPKVDRETGLVVMDTKLGGKAYLDPRLGQVRFTGGLPLATSEILLQYTPKFKRVSVGTASGYTGASMFVDNRFEGLDAPRVTKYWANNSGGSIVAGDHPRVNRMVLTYNRAAAGAGQSARPMMKTMRLGIQLPYRIYTDETGNMSFGGTPTLQLGAPVSGFFQVDPVKGRVYFSPEDEGKSVVIDFYWIDSSDGTAHRYINPVTGNPGYTAPITWITETEEAPVPVEQAVNEANLFAFPDPLDDPAFPRPNLIWMFWTSTRSGSPDIYFQTMAPSFAPKPAGN